MYSISLCLVSQASCLSFLNYQAVASPAQQHPAQRTHSTRIPLRPPAPSPPLVHQRCNNPAHWFPNHRIDWSVDFCASRTPLGASTLVLRCLRNRKLSNWSLVFPLKQTHTGWWRMLWQNSWKYDILLSLGGRAGTNPDLLPIASGIATLGTLVWKMFLPRLYDVRPFWIHCCPFKAFETARTAIQLSSHLLNAVFFFCGPKHVHSSDISALLQDEDRQIQG